MDSDDGVLSEEEQDEIWDMQEARAQLYEAPYALDLLLESWYPGFGDPKPVEVLGVDEADIALRGSAAGYGDKVRLVARALCDDGRQYEITLDAKHWFGPPSAEGTLE